MRWGYEVVLTPDGEAAWEKLQCEDAPSLLILDWMMPRLDGVELCRRVRARESHNPPYIILLTARGSKEDVVIGLDSGANDYLEKPFNHDELRARLEVGRRLVELNQKLLETQHALELQAHTDALTGVMNRRAILDRLEEEMARAERQGTSLGVGMIDIDFFKLINDTFGHAVGDDVLREVVSRSLVAMRPYDTFGRFGGEEFLVIVPNVTHAQLQTVLERIRQAASMTLMKADSPGFQITVSIGGTTSHGEPLDVLIGLADDALYQAKAEGRNRVVMVEGTHPNGQYTTADRKS